MDFKSFLADELKQQRYLDSDADRPLSALDKRNVYNRARPNRRRRDQSSQRAYDNAIINAASNDPKNPGGDAGENAAARRAMKLRASAYGPSRHGGKRGLRRIGGGY